MIFYYSLSLFNVDVIWFMVQYFFDVDCLDKDQCIFFFIVVILGCLNNLKYLIRRGVNLSYSIEYLDVEIFFYFDDFVSECKRKLCGYLLLYVVV